jgi:Fic family protein
MRWNWQLPDWPDFRFDADRIRASEEQFLKGSGVVIGALHHLDADARDGLTIELISQEVVDSSAIEGEILDRASVQSSLARHLGFATDQRRASAAEAGAAELMADVYRNHAAPLDDQTLFAWHAMVMNGRRDITDVGRYRRHQDAMQIVSGALHAPRVHFEAPPSDTVPAEMSRFIAWFNDSAPESAKPLPAITRAAISHLWFESIHPFEDGNGRIGARDCRKSVGAKPCGPDADGARGNDQSSPQSLLRRPPAREPEQRHQCLAGMVCRYCHRGAGTDDHSHSLPDRQDSAA